MKKIPDEAASLSAPLKTLFDQIARAGLGPEELFKSALEKTAVLVKAASASIRLYDKKSGELLIAAGYCADNKHPAFKAAVGTAGAEGKVFIEQKVCSSCDMTEDNPASRPGEDALSYTGIPITSRGWKLGVFSMYFSEGKKFSRQELDALSVNNPAPRAQGVRRL